MCSFIVSIIPAEELVFSRGALRVLFVRLFDGLPCFRILDFIPVAAGFSIAFISNCQVSEKATKQSDFGEE